MAAVPCGFSIDCRNLAGGDNGGGGPVNGVEDFNGLDFPITNFSSEAPEQVPGTVIMTFPTLWNKMGCLALCVSTVSQNAANLCAMAQQAQCNPTNDPGGGGGGGGGGPGTQIFFNQPQQCSFTCPNGSQFFYTAPAGIFSASTQAIANALANAFACQMAVQPCNPDNPGDPPNKPPIGGGFLIGDIPAGCLNAAYSHPIQTLPPSSAVLWTVIIGALPTGLTLNSTTGVISGTPTVAGSFGFMIRAFNVDGNFSQRAYTRCIIEISPGSLAAAEVGVAYSQALTATSCAPAGVWLVSSGALPTGLTLNPATGVISGIPTLEGTYIFSVTLSGATYSCSKEFALTVDPCTNITNSSLLPDGQNDVAYSEQLNSVGIDNPVWTIMAGALPPGLSLTGTGLIFGVPSVPESASYGFTVLADGDNKLCSKTFSLTVNALTGIPWEDLVWAIENSAGNDVWSAGATDTGDSVNFQVSCGPDAGGSSTVSFSYSAGELATGVGIVWAGGAVNCNLHLDEVFAVDDGAGGRIVNFNIYLDAIQIVNGTCTWVTGNQQDIPFTITGPGVITCLLQAGAVVALAGEQKLIHCIATISNV